MTPPVPATPGPKPPTSPVAAPAPPSTNDLGVAAFPNTAPSSDAMSHRWETPRLHPPQHRIGYAHGSEAAALLERYHGHLAQQLRFRDLGGGRFRWSLPPACTRYQMGCIFQAFSESSAPHLEPLAARLAREVQSRQFNASQAAEFLLSFVQSIRYQIPSELPFGILGPALVASRGWGDCDSKSLLLKDLLRYVGIDSVLISSNAHRHSMLGIAIPTSGRTFTANGRRYAFAESTAVGAPIGWINPQLLSPNDWQSVHQPDTAPAVSRRALQRATRRQGNPPAPASPSPASPAPPNVHAPKSR